MASSPTATSFAVLGLLGLQPWTAYDLVAQARRSLHYFWPRSEAHLYAELKRLVERGHAHAEVVEGRRRQATRYTITPQGHAALEEWLATEPAPPTIEIEALLRVLFADHGSLQDLRAALRATAQQTSDLRIGLLALGEQALSTGGPFPERLHLVERVGALYGEFLLLLQRWCEETLAEIETWPDTRELGLTPQAHKRFAQWLDRARQDPT
jgi:PadR family transcriptional regulator, regulatory protein AphA